VKKDFSSSDYIWQEAASAADRVGCIVYDVDGPCEDEGVLRIFIEAKEGVEGVTHDHCVFVSRFLIDHPKVDTFIPDEVTLEVSTPGINRRLRLPEHFVMAVGQRIDITYLEENCSEQATQDGFASDKVGTSGKGSVEKVYPKSSGVKLKKYKSRAHLDEVRKNKDGVVDEIVVTIIPKGIPKGTPKGLNVPKDVKKIIKLSSVSECRVDFVFLS